MPELPDVENERRYLKRTALSKAIVRTHLHESKLLFETSKQSLYQNLSNHCLDLTRRHGKYLFAHIDNGRWLMLHFGMTGTLDYHKCRDTPPQFTIMTLEFDNGYALSYLSPRKLGKIAIIESPQSLIARAQLGPDALTLSGEEFVSRIENGRGQLKSWLMDQSHLAGVGNIYADEILFHARLHPKHPVNELDRKDIQRLHGKLQHVLNTAIEKKADPGAMPRSWLLPYREQRKFNCPRCGEPVKITKVNGRTTYYCDQCQR